MLNKTLRVQNIELLYLFRFLIRDIYQLLQQSIGKLISISSFFSTSMNRNKALEFVDDFNDLHRVLFIINADPPRVVKSKPFADISQFSHDNDQSEVHYL